MAARRPQDILRELIAIFPSFETWWAEAEGTVPAEDGLVDNVYYEWTYHRILQECLVYFGTNTAQFSKAQLEGFGSWVNSAIATEDVLENAVSTCFLEHMDQVQVDGILSPYLSKAAIARSHA